MHFTATSQSYSPMIELAAYLRRIGYDGPLQPNLATLRALHRAHVMAIPYENFDVQLERPVTTDAKAAFDKIVTGRRGGWCYEMNGVLGLALEAIGFDVKRLAADGSMPDSHLVLTVALQDATYESGHQACDAIEPRSNQCRHRGRQA